MKKTKKNFTLVELLCATALVVILAGIGFSAYSYASHRGKEAATKSLVTRLDAALETLKTKHGIYPASTSYSPITVTLTSDLITKVTFGSTELTAAQLKDFLAAADGENLKKHIANDVLTDAWGGTLRYQYPGTINKIRFDIVVPGADEKFGKAATADDPCSSLDDYKEGDEWACDDIANFK